MKLINLYRVTVSPAARGLLRAFDGGFKATFLTNPNRDEILEAVSHATADLMQRLTQARDDDDEVTEGEAKEQIEKLATILEILDHWRPEPHSIEVDQPIAIKVASVQIGTIKFESEPVFDVRVS